MVGDETIAGFHSSFDFIFQVCGGLAYSRNPQVHKAKLLKGGKLSDFLGDLSADHVLG